MRKLLYTLCLLFSAAFSARGQASFFDPTFGTGGKTLLNRDGVFNKLVLQADGKIVAVGSMTVARFKQNGTSDSSFGNNGFYNYPATSGGLYDVVIQPDGKVVAVGNVSLSSWAYLNIRLNIDGTPDMGFGTGGVVIFDRDFSTDEAYAVALQSDGKIVVAGSTYPSNIGVLRLHSNGVVDSSFGANGFEKSVYCSEVADIAVASDGKIVVGGTAPASQNYKFMAVRYSSDGALDLSFNGTGVAYAQAGESGSNFGRAMKLQPDNKILVGGVGGFGAEGGNFAVVRFNTDGSLDNSFGIGGIANVDIDGGDESGWDMSLAPDGRICLAGITGPNGHAKFATVCFNGSGVPDHSFGSDGSIVNGIAGSEDFARCIVWQPDGKIIVGGFGSFVGNNYKPQIVRYSTMSSDVKDVRKMERNFLYPNPTTGPLHVSSSISEKVAVVYVYNVQGIRVKEVNKFAGGVISLEDLRDGSYIVTLNLNSGEQLANTTVIKH